MDLLPPELLKTLPKLYSGENEAGADKTAYVKIFDPGGRFTMYVTEGQEEGDDVLLFGFTVSPQGEDCDEWGYASLSELKAVRNRLNLPLERDLHWCPTKMSEIDGLRF